MVVLSENIKYKAIIPPNIINTCQVICCEMYAAIISNKSATTPTALKCDSCFDFNYFRKLSLMQKTNQINCCREVSISFSSKLNCITNDILMHRTSSAL